MIQPMKRILAVAVTAGAMAGLIVTAPAAGAAEAKRAPELNATLRVVPGWTYQGTGKLAVIASCSPRGDVPVIKSSMLPGPFALRQGHNLLIKVTGKTRPGRYEINLYCTGKHQIDSAAMRKVRILKVLPAFQQPAAPGLPKGFRPDAVVSTGPHR